MNAPLPDPDPLADLDVFYGDLTVSRATVYARLPASAERGGTTLAGQVRGPRCATAQTLPATASLVDMGPGPTLLARALVTDPSFWSADLPAIYDVVVELRRGSEVVAQAKRQIGFRPLSVRGKWILREEKPWVLRGVLTSSTAECEPRAWREARAVLVQDRPGAEMLEEASRIGALVVACGDDWQAVARQPAVAMIVAPTGEEIGQRAPNVLRVADLRGRESFSITGLTIEKEMAKKAPDPGLWTPPPWAQAVLVEVEEPQAFAMRVGRLSMPVIAVRPLREPRSVADARAGCDQLQRDLAPFGQYAGYVV